MAHLCLQHASKVGVDGKPVPDAGAHEAQCPVCHHPEHQRILSDWVSWLISTSRAIAELGVSEKSFYRHVHYQDLLTKKSSRTNTIKALVLAAEKGLSSPDGHNPKTGIEALRQLSKERGDVERVDVRVAHVDLTRMSDAELAAHAQQLAQQLSGGVVEGSVEEES